MDIDIQQLMQQAAEQVSATHTREISQQLDAIREQFLQSQKELLAQFNRGQPPQSRCGR
jgi:hypothetical protein